MNTNRTRLADLVADFVATQLGVSTVFTVTGGGAMYLNDAFGKHPKLSIVPMHHEQGTAMAAEGYYRETGNIAVCQVTTGPGGTNAVTGCAGAWVDSEAVMFISGQVESISIGGIGSRQTGVQELDITEIVKSITKACVKLKDPYLIRYELDRLAALATTGRHGPVWLDIPLELQNFSFDDIERLPRFKPLDEDKRIKKIKTTRFKKVAALLKSAERPVVLVGNGSRNAKPALLKFLESTGVPVITGWNARDLVSENPNLLGSAGLFGNRPANLALHKADLVIGLGYRFSVPQVGYDPSCYAPDATIISVEIDPTELTKVGAFIDVPVNSSVADFLEHIEAQGAGALPSLSKGWVEWCKYLASRDLDPKPANKEIINSFDFNDVLAPRLAPGDTVVTDMGTSFTCTHQDLRLGKGVKLFTSSGVAAMGFGLPGAIGCSHAKKKGRTILISGDGGLMFNLQELQTVATFKSNLKIIVYENGGYLTMKHMQEARFKTLVGSDSGSLLKCADFVKVGNAIGIESREVKAPGQLDDAMGWLMDGYVGPKLLVVHIDPWQPLLPRVQTRSDASGRLFPPSLDQMFPHLTEDVETEINSKYRALLDA